MATVVSPVRTVLKRQRFQSTPRPIAVEPHLSVIVVNYCQWKNTRRLLKELRRSRAARNGHAEIVIVDNHSPGHRLIRKLRRIDGVSLRRFKRNRGFARAVNEGCRLSRGDWYLLLNPDMSVPAGFLNEVDALCRRLEGEDPRIGVIGLGVKNSDGSPQPSCGPLPTLLGTLTGLFLHRAVRKCKHLAASERIDVPWATGCALLVRRDCLRDVGGFDEDFFLYYEDVDFCRRAAERGWKVCHEPTLTVTHHSPLHGRQVSAPLRFVTRHALLTYGIKHWSRLQSTLLGGLIWLEAGMRQFAAWWRGRRNDALFHEQTRHIVGHALGQRRREVRQTIRVAAEHLAAGASAQDGQTS